MNETVHATNKNCAIIDLHWKRLYLFKVINNATHTVICTFSIRQSMNEWFYSENIWRCGIWRWTSLLVLLNCTRGTASRLVLLNCTKGVSLFDAKPLFEPILIDWQIDSREQNITKLEWKYDFCSRKWIWNAICKMVNILFRLQYVKSPHQSTDDITKSKQITTNPVHIFWGRLCVGFLVVGQPNDVSVQWRSRNEFRDLHWALTQFNLI